MVNFTFDIEIHVRGCFVEELTIKYVGRYVRLLTEIGPDKLSFFEIRDLCHLVGAPKEHSRYKYLLLKGDLQDDLRNIETYANVLNMTTLHMAWPVEKIIICIEINVEPLAVEYPNGGGVVDGGVGGDGGGVAVADGDVGGDGEGLANGVGGDEGGNVGGDMVNFTFDIEIHVRGCFVEEPTIKYVGRSVRLLTEIGPDKLSFFEIRDLCHLVGAPKEHSRYKYLLLKGDLQDDLRNIETYADVLNMTTLHMAWSVKKIIIYTEIDVEPLAVEYPNGGGVVDGGVGGDGGGVAVADGGVGGGGEGLANGVGGDEGGLGGYLTGEQDGSLPHSQSFTHLGRPGMPYQVLHRSTGDVRTRGQLAGKRPPKMNSMGGKRKE
nr:hypothetical protein CFP56_32688 [Quercus suber]